MDTDDAEQGRCSERRGLGCSKIQCIVSLICWFAPSLIGAVRHLMRRVADSLTPLLRSEAKSGGFDAEFVAHCSGVPVYQRVLLWRGGHDSAAHDWPGADRAVVGFRALMVFTRQVAQEFFFRAWCPRHSEIFTLECRTRRWSTTAAPRLRFDWFGFAHSLSVGHARYRRQWLSLVLPGQDCARLIQ